MPNIVADIGINHGGDFSKALEMAAKLRVQVVKMQKLDPRSFLSDEEFDRPHPVPENAFGETYGLHKEALEFTRDQYRGLEKQVHLRGMKFATSVFDKASIDFAVQIKFDYIKIPSCCCGRIDLIRYLREKWAGPIHVSTGMTLRHERNLLELEAKRLNLTLYSCLSNYTGTDADLFYETQHQGFSCHRPDIGYGVAAAMRGAEWIEYHVTDDRDAKGTDHKISLLIPEINELARLVNTPLESHRPPMAEHLEKPFREKLWRGVG